MPWLRIVSGVIAIALALTAAVLGGWYFTGGFAVLVYLGQVEYFNLVRAKGIVPAVKTTLFVSQLMLIFSTASAYLHNPLLAEAVLPIAATLICFYPIFLPKLSTIADISSSVLGLFYAGYLPSYWIRLRLLDSTDNSSLPLGGYWPPIWPSLPDLPKGLSATVLAFLCIWAADIGAYTIGKLFGKTRLSDISPRKTVEGAMFGLLSSMGVAIAGAWSLHWPFWIASGALLGLLIGVTSLLGDLIESMMKRDAGVKDSGQLIPGHGGILDRADSYVFTAPLVYFYVTLFLPLLKALH
ncbi:MAG: phosphatidate cytidylyltransferase [Thermosynechococcaceae cyanobacterium]